MIEKEKCVSCEKETEEDITHLLTTETIMLKELVSFVKIVG